MSEAKFTWQGGAISQQMRLALGRANRANAGRLAEYAAKQAPVETGDLRGSLNPGAPDGRWREEADGLNMTVGSNLPYAAVQHEDLSLNHNGPEVPGGKAKYLEDPLNAHKQEFLQALADAARGVCKR